MPKYRILLIFPGLKIKKIITMRKLLLFIVKMLQFIIMMFC